METLTLNGTLAVTLRVAIPKAGTKLYLSRNGKLIGPGVIAKSGTVTFKGVPNTTVSYVLVQKLGKTTVKSTTAIKIVAVKKR
ncbi:MAG: hypothetical protein F2923_04540 [Actinobacteria bacterium]|uniref:Unannotated protein n=1 Tax=freshwater metagenome TaxID=449393 RepID=A0A6J7SCV7_9ZZZZ|nr:hypothetical protein [Actinomycetota bacterium]